MLRYEQQPVIGARRAQVCDAETPRHCALRKPFTSLSAETVGEAEYQLSRLG